MNTLPMTAATELIVEQDVPYVSSLKVAEHFGKQHKNVLRLIQKISAECSPEFGRLNFEPSSYVNAQGKKQPCYNITRAGFASLALSLTGKDALPKKIRYIEAFEAMETRIREELRREVKSLKRDDSYTPRERVFLAGKLKAMLDRERPERRELVSRVMLFCQVGDNQAWIAKTCRISRYVVSRIVRRYAPFKKNFVDMELTGRAYERFALEAGKEASHETLR